MANKKAKIKLITVVSNSSGRMAHFTVDGKGDSRRFPIETTDAEIRKKLGSVKADKKVKADTGGDDEVSDRIKELREEAKKLGVKATHFMTNEETLLAKIAEAKAEADNGGDE